jgi:hypothetical protein
MIATDVVAVGITVFKPHPALDIEDAARLHSARETSLPPFQ